MDKVEAIEAGYVSNRTNAVYDYEFTKALQNVPWSQWLEQDNPFRCKEEYLDKYVDWISSSQLNRVSGLGRFSQRHLINGTTQCFDELYYKYSDRRLRIFRGEYAYHRRIAKSWSFLEDGPIESNDYIIVSAPFCSTGDVHPKMYEAIEEAYRLKVPVAVDCAYFGTCTEFELNVDHPGIESVSFSLTKGVGLGDIRSGIRFSNIEDQNPISQQNAYNHSVLGAAKVGIYMMEKFSPDFIPNKYRKIQIEVCELLGITPTKCMHLALGDEQWSEFKVDQAYNRLGIRELIRAKNKGKIE